MPPWVSGGGHAGHSAVSKSPRRTAVLVPPETCRRHRRNPYGCVHVQVPTRGLVCSRRRLTRPERGEAAARASPHPTPAARFGCFQRATTISRGCPGSPGSRYRSNGRDAFDAGDVGRRVGIQAALARRRSRAPAPRQGPRAGVLHACATSPSRGPISTSDHAPPAPDSTSCGTPRTCLQTARAQRSVLDSKRTQPRPRARGHCSQFAAT
ncbi:hypothetical protein B0H10DRAFT_64287 [Mycena sp. CBHHK59/15]|nr:hypothetical protein B0H10DRAFT_64287 [Mycena sp. CBHHK59/15]